MPLTHWEWGEEAPEWLFAAWQPWTAAKPALSLAAVLEQSRELAPQPGTDILPRMSAVGGKYELGERLGGGGMADVFRATTRGAEGFARPVAIKRIKRSISTDKGFAKLFVTEARLAAKLRHPNVVQTLDFDRDERGCFYLVMELIDGVDLRALATSGRVPVSACCYLISEVLRGLDYAHELVEDGHPITIIHRDISPHNIMLGWQGSVKIVDFGIAKAIEGSMVSRSGSLKGKVAYMSPEQVHGHSLDGRSDLFAVGVILHELLTGTRLFVGKTEAETLSKVLTQPVASPRSLNDLVPPDLDAIVMRLLQRDRADRFTRARDAMEAIVDSSTSVTKGRRDLETILSERFSESVPTRTPRLSHSPSPASSASFGTLPSSSGVQEEMGSAATVAADVQALAVKETVPNGPRSKPVPKRTFTAEPALKLGTANTAQAPAEVGLVDDEPLVVARNSRLPLVMAVLGVVAAAVLGVVLLGGGSTGEPTHGSVEVIAVKSVDPGQGDQAIASISDAAPQAAPTHAAADVQDASPQNVEVLEVDASVAVTTNTKSTKASSATDHEKAVLTIRVKPWATVMVDGKNYGQTPQTVSLRRGKHRIVLENSGLDRRESFSLSLSAGQKKTIDKNWQ